MLRKAEHGPEQSASPISPLDDQPFVMYSKICTRTRPVPFRSLPCAILHLIHLCGVAGSSFCSVPPLQPATHSVSLHLGLSITRHGSGSTSSVLCTSCLPGPEGRIRLSTDLRFYDKKDWDGGRADERWMKVWEIGDGLYDGRGSLC